MRKLKTLYPDSFSIESEYQQSFQTNTYFYCNLCLPQYQCTFRSNWYCIFSSIVYLATLVQDTYELHNSSMISVHIIQLSLLLSFSMYISLRQYYEFPFILRGLRHIYQCASCQLQSKSKARAMIGRCRFIECVVRRKFS